MEQKKFRYKRDANLHEASEALDEVRSTVAAYGMTVVTYGVKPSDSHEWQFRGNDGKLVMQYWTPSKNSLVAGTRNYRILSDWREATKLAIDTFLAKKAG